MSLQSGAGSMKKNIHELTTGKVGSSRAKAIQTLSKKWNVSPDEAKAKQAWIIAKSQLKKKTKSKGDDFNTSIYMAL